MVEKIESDRDNWNMKSLKHLHTRLSPPKNIKVAEWQYIVLKRYNIQIEPSFRHSQQKLNKI